MPERYQQWITSEIHRILRDIEKQDTQENTQAVWRRENDIRSELEKSKVELASLVERVIEFENKCDQLKQHAIVTEEKELQALNELEKAIKVYYYQQNEDTIMVLSDEEDAVLHLNKVVSKGKKKKVTTYK